MSFVVFDACRNVPCSARPRTGFKGFAPVREQNGLLVAFATEPGNVAIDQSLYAKALAEEIVKPGLEAAQVFRACGCGCARTPSEQAVAGVPRQAGQRFPLRGTSGRGRPAATSARTCKAIATGRRHSADTAACPL